MIVDLEKDKEITYELLSDLLCLVSKHTGYEFISRYYSNDHDMAGYIFERISDKKLFFVENYSLDSWYNGDGFSHYLDSIAVFEAEVIKFETFLLYKLTKERSINIVR